MKKCLIIALCLMTLLSANNLFTDKKQNSFYLETNMVALHSPAFVEVAPGYSINGRFNLEYHYGTSFTEPYFDLYRSISMHGIEIDYMLLKHLDKKIPFALSLNMKYDLGIYYWNHTIIETPFYSNNLGGGLNLYYYPRPIKKIRIIPGIGIQFGKFIQQIPPEIDLYGSPNYYYLNYPLKLYFQIKKFYFHINYNIETRCYTWANAFHLEYGTWTAGIGFLITP